MVAAAVQGFDMVIYENRCAVAGRQTQHDCMFFKWSCLQVPHAGAPAWLADRQVRPLIQETKSSALADPARDPSEPASGAARGTSSASGAALEADQIEAEETPGANTLEADEVSLCGSADYGEAQDEKATLVGHFDSIEGSNIPIYSSIEHADDVGASEHANEAGASEHADEDDARRCDLQTVYCHRPRPPR